MYFQFFKSTSDKIGRSWLLSASILSNEFVVGKFNNIGMTKADFIKKNKMKSKSYKNNIVYQTLEGNQGCIFYFSKDTLYQIDYYTYPD